MNCDTSHMEELPKFFCITNVRTSHIYYCCFFTTSVKCIMNNYTDLSVHLKKAGHHFIYPNCSNSVKIHRCSVELSTYLVLEIKNTNSFIFGSVLYFVFIAVSSHVMIYE